MTPSLDPAKPKLAKRDLRLLRLDNGAHESRADGVCIQEAAAWAAGADHSDKRLPCVSPAVHSFLIAWNDSLDDDGRQKLKPYIFKQLGTATTAADERVRGWMATDWLVREFTPAWLRLAGLTKHAEMLENLAALTDAKSARKAQPCINEARSAARSAAYSAARSAAYSAADSAAYSAARSAAYSAAGSAAYSAADSAAYSAAGSAARSAARSAADSAARSAAYSAAYSAAGSAARSAADSAARSALEPTVKILQKSAVSLLDRMIAVGAA
jgi:hypothetical protein